MFKIFLFERYLRRTLSYKKIVFDLTHMISIVDLVAIDLKTLKLDSRCSLEK